MTWLQVPDADATHSPSMNRLGTAVSIEPGGSGVKAWSRASRRALGSLRCRHAVT
jgi:hypothetical protein